MGGFFLVGYRRVVRQWRVVLFLYAAGLLLGFAGSTAAWLWLQGVLDRSLATRTLLTDLDANVFVDLWAHHGDSLGIFAVSMGALAGAGMLAWVGLNAVALAAVGDAVGARDAFRRAGGLYVPFLGLWVVAMVANLAVVGLAAAGCRLALLWTVESPNEMTSYALAAAFAVPALCLLLLSSTVHDHARIHGAATGAGAPAALRWSLKFVLRREWRALPLALSFVVAGGICWAMYHGVAALVAPTAGPGLAASLVWGQLWMLARVFLRLCCFAAATDLQDAREVP